MPLIFQSEPTRVSVTESLSASVLITYAVGRGPGRRDAQPVGR
jgi:hypothetical protein